MFGRLQRLAGQTTGYMLGTFFQRGVPFLLIPLYTAFLRPEAFAILGFSEILISLSRIGFTFGLDVAAFRFHFVFLDHDNRRRFFGSIWTFQLLASLAIAVALSRSGASLFGPLLRQVPFDPYIRLALWIGFFRAGFEVMALQLFRARGAAGTFATYSFIAFILAIGLQVYFVAVERSGAKGALQASLMTSALMAILYSWRLLSWSSFRVSWSHISRGLRYGLPLLPHFFAHWVLSLSDRWILERNVPMADLGVYTLGDRFRQGFTVLPWSANSALMRTFGKAGQNKQDREAIPRLSTYYFLAMCTAGLGVVLFTPVVLPLISPPAYSGAEGIVPWLILGTILFGTYFLPVNVLSQTVGKTRAVSVATVTAGLGNIGLNLLLIPRWGIMAAAVNTAIGYAILLVLTHYLAERHLQIPYEFKRLATALAVAIGLFALSLLVPEGQPVWLGWLCRTALLVLYPLILLATGFFNSSERKTIQRSLIGRARE